MTTITPEARLFRPAVELREIETTTGYRHLSGIAVPHDRETDIGWYLEEFAPGSFAKSIKESARDLPLLLFHNAAALPIGVATQWADESDALRGVWRLDKSDEAQNAARLAADGMLSGLSVRFSPIRSEWTTAQDFNPDLGPKHKDRVRRTEARLLETSLVSTPAYDGAAVEFVRTSERSLHADARGTELAGWRNYLDSVRG